MRTVGLITREYIKISSGLPRKEELFNHHIRDIFGRISDETVLKVGKPARCHPKNFILSIIRVPPNTIRPDIRRVGGPRSNNNDTTILACYISKLNATIPKTIPDVISKDEKEAYFGLDMAHYELVKGSSSSGNQVRLVTTSNKPPSSLASRAPGKSGRLRKNLMGKRTWKMFRSVITGDNSLRVDEIGIPIKLARSIQIPETVRTYNKDKLNIYYMNKKNIYPGCSGVTIKDSNKFHRIDHLDPSYELQEGDVVMRDLIEGDYIGFNRQPSLLFGNIGSHRIKVMEKGSTIRISVSACAP
jgi:DNA-directed RNA polymerase II subunit RPB1